LAKGGFTNRGFANTRLNDWSGWVSSYNQSPFVIMMELRMVNLKGVEAGPEAYDAAVLASLRGAARALGKAIRDEAHARLEPKKDASTVGASGDTMKSVRYKDTGRAVIVYDDGSGQLPFLADDSPRKGPPSESVVAAWMRAKGLQIQIMDKDKKPVTKKAPSIGVSRIIGKAPQEALAKKKPRDTEQIALRKIAMSIWKKGRTSLLDKHPQGKKAYDLWDELMIKDRQMVDEMALKAINGASERLKYYIATGRKPRMTNMD